MPELRNIQLPLAIHYPLFLSGGFRHPLLWARMRQRKGDNVISIFPALRKRDHQSAERNASIGTVTTVRLDWEVCAMEVRSCDVSELETLGDLA